jgi:hypothetical protein
MSYLLTFSKRKIKKSSKHVNKYTYICHLAIFRLLSPCLLGVVASLELEY